ncbi:MAG: radical SAM protein [Candidatus Omnitrophota bacterium]
MRAERRTIVPVAVVSVERPTIAPANNLSLFVAILKQQYKLPSGIVIKRKGNKRLFLNPSVPAWIVTNPNGAKALKLCNGKRTVEEISKRISTFLQRDARDEIQNFFQEVVSQSNLFSLPDQERFPRRPHGLQIVHLNLTDKCNLKCIYCYADERVGKKQKLQHRDYLELVDSINNISRDVKIALTGGEPLMASYALDVAEYAKKKGNQVHLISNGILINKENAERIAEVFDLIKISLDGSTRQVHDFHRGEASYDRTEAAIELLIRNNASLQISMTVTKKNIGDIESMVSKYGSRLSFAPLFKAGRARKKKGLAVTGSEYYKALSSIEGVDPLGYLCSSLDATKRRRITKCATGDGEISISDTGDVYPCHLLHLPQFLAGNVREQPLEFIYQTSEKLKVCRELTVSKIKGCRECDIRFICGGACRARAFYEKDRIDVSDDFCRYEKLAFINGLFELHKFR